MRLTPDRAALARQLDSLATRRARAAAHRVDLERRRLIALARRPVLADPAAIVAIQRSRAEDTRRRLAGAVAARAARARRGLADLEIRLERHRPHEAFARRRDTLAHLARELRAAVHARRDAERKTVSGLAALLHAVDPTAVLDRGYSITTRADGTVVRAPRDVRSGDRVRTRVAGGELDSVVTADDAGNPPQPPTSDKPHAAPPPAHLPDAPLAPDTGKAPARPRKPTRPSPPDQPGLFGGG
jgi:exodeoxyribonuclease VII large subunit